MTRAWPLALLVGAVACAHAPRSTRAGKLLDLWTQVSDRSYLRVRGIGAVPLAAKGQTARRGHSRNAALAAARYELLSVIRGVKLEGGISIGHLMERDSLIKEIANAVVAGGEEVSTEWLADDGCVVLLELRRARVEQLIREKTAREKDLEKRLARAIADVRRANTALEIATMSDRDRRKWGEVHDGAVKALSLADDLDRIERKVDSGDQSALADFAEVGGRLKKEEDDSCWFPLSACYWGHGTFGISGSKQ